MALKSIRVSVLLLVAILVVTALSGTACKSGRFTVVNYESSGEGNELVYTFDSLKGEMVETATTVVDAVVLRVKVELTRGIMEISVMDAANNVLVHGAASPSYISSLEGSFPAGAYRVVYKVHDTAQHGRVEIHFEPAPDVPSGD